MHLQQRLGSTRNDRYQVSLRTGVHPQRLLAAKPGVPRSLQSHRCSAASGRGGSTAGGDAKEPTPNWQDFKQRLIEDYGEIAGSKIGLPSSPCGPPLSSCDPPFPTDTTTTHPPHPDRSAAGAAAKVDAAGCRADPASADVRLRLVMREKPAVGLRRLGGRDEDAGDPLEGEEVGEEGGEAPARRVLAEVAGHAALLREASAWAQGELAGGDKSEVGLRPTHPWSHLTSHNPPLHHTHTTHTHSQTPRTLISITPPPARG
jgi:hypothetical protein